MGCFFGCVCTALNSLKSGARAQRSVLTRRGTSSDLLNLLLLISNNILHTLLASSSLVKKAIRGGDKDTQKETKQVYVSYTQADALRFVI